MYIHLSGEETKLAIKQYVSNQMKINILDIGEVTIDKITGKIADEIGVNVFLCPVIHKRKSGD